MDEQHAFRELIDGFPDLVCMITPEGELLYVNEAYAAYFGSTPPELVGRNYLELVPVDTLVEARQILAGIRELTPTHPVRVTEHPGGDDPSGTRRWQQWVDKALFDAEGRMTQVVCVGRDITTRVATEEEIRHTSAHDSLTGLANRRRILGELDAAVCRAEQTGLPVGLLYIDLDDFKQVNDAHGHRAGDRVLTEIADVLAASVRQHVDVVGRLGGDEFIVVCRDIPTLAGLQDIAARITAGLATMDPPTEASIGMVVHRGGESADELLQRGDEAMYADKQRRRQRRVTSGRQRRRIATVVHRRRMPLAR